MSPPALSERAWQEVVVELARLYRWHIHHDRPAMNARGQYATHVQGDPGFPDLVLAGYGRLILAELKTDARSSVLDDAQIGWRDVLMANSGVEWYCWRPRHLPEVREILAAPAKAIRDVLSGGGRS